MAKFEKGKTKTGGRVKGTPNKVSKPIKENLMELVQNSFDSGKLQSELATLEGKDYVDAISKILPYVIAKPTQSIDVETNAPFNIVLTSPIPKDE